MIRAGDTVRWTNDSSASEGHTATGKELRLGLHEAGRHYSHKFKKPGSFSYICSIHPFMKGTVTVKSSGSGGGNGGGGGSSGGSNGSGSSGGGGGGTAGGSSPGFTTPGSSGASGRPGQLPSTGLALAPLAGTGFALMLLGLALWRRAWLYY